MVVLPFHCPQYWVDYGSGLFLEAGVVFAVAEYLGQEVFAVAYFNVGDDAVVVVNCFVHGVYEALVGGDVELGVAVEHFFVELGINLHGVFLHKCCAGFIVAFALDALDFAEELSEEVAQLGVVVDLYVGLAAFLHELNHLVFLAVLKCPCGYELAVAHVGFFDVFAGFDAHELGHKAVEDILVVFGFVSVGIVEQTEFEQFGIGQIVEGEEVGACFFEGRTVGLEGVGVNTGEDAARAVAKALVEVGVEIVGDKEIFVEELAGGSVDYKFFVEAVAVRSFVVGLGDVFEGDRL